MVLLFPGVPGGHIIKYGMFVVFPLGGQNGQM